MSESCNGTPTFDRGRGTATYGTKGTLVLDRDGYVIYDLKGKVVKQNIEPKRGNGVDLVGDDAATLTHMENFAAAIRTGEALPRRSRKASRPTCCAISATSRSSPVASSTSIPRTATSPATPTRRSAGRDVRTGMGADGLRFFFFFFFCHPERSEGSASVLPLSRPEQISPIG